VSGPAPRRGRIAAAFLHWLEAGGERVGEIVIRSNPRGGYRLTHHEEADLPPGAFAALETFHRPEDARQIALSDDAGEYRPLKSAANLRHGWRLELDGPEALCRAIEFLYPTLTGIWLAREEGRLAVVALRATLERQSGMYAVTRRATRAGAEAAMARCCRNPRAGCLRTILWEIEPGHPAPVPEGAESGSEGLPLLCPEACNLLVAAIREEVKSK